MKIRIGLGLVTAAALVVGPVTAQGQTTAKKASIKGKPVTLWGWVSSPEEDSSLTTLLTDFNKSTGAKAKFQSQKEFDTALQAALASGSGPDVFYVDSNKFPDLVKAGALAAPPAGALSNPTGIYPSLRTVFTSNGKLVCPPKDFSTLALVYDADFLAAKGVKPPTTWAELKDAAAKLTTDGRVGLSMGMEYPRVGTFMFQAGGALTDDKVTKMTAATAENKAAMTYLSDLYKAKTLQAPDDLGVGWAGEALGKQKAAMVIEGNWIVDYLRKEFPTVKPGYAELPAGPKGKGTFAFTVCYGVSKSSKNQAAAWQLVDYLTNAQGSLRWTTAFKVMPAHASVADQWLATKPELKPFVSGAAYARKFQFVPGFNDVLGEFNKGLKGALKGDTTIDEYLEKVDKLGGSVLK